MLRVLWRLDSQPTPVSVVVGDLFRWRLRDGCRLKLSNTHMKESLSSRSVVTLVFVCLLSGSLPVACSRRPEPDISLQQRLVGTWRYSRSDGTRTALPPSDLTFTVTSNGGYISRITNPQAHTLEGIAEVKNGLLIITD